MRKPTANALIEAMRAAAPTRPKPEGKEWVTTREVAKELSLSNAGARTQLMMWLAQGKAERIIGRGPTGGQISYWKLKNGKAK